MAELSTLARPYAEAAFKLAKQTNTTQAWSEQLQFLATVAQDADVAAIFGNPRIDRAKVSELLLDISQDQIQAEAGNLVKLLVENGRLQLLPTISSMYADKLAEDEGYVNVELFSAYALTKAELSKYSAMLEKQLHKKVNAVVTVDKSLIGGILAKAGDKVIDGSIKGQIHQLAKRL
ncbi:F0F1 ATP synthase subunit delta [Methylomonas paludis]|uniref:ATP synthase subunit delta n=1 Tax=Methylomonas paludis TaxID=1173101 RepID=A0A975RA06_9GAMM|nr:F0F1 ATP synthase subunit delta [Methylomonas paludis]QWF70833.1 F0F1 ATP synthase subunit delta [Methylomonas paludis]